MLLANNLKPQEYLSTDSSNKQRNATIASIVNFPLSESNLDSQRAKISMSFVKR